MSLPAILDPLIFDRDGDLAVPDPDTGELTHLRDASNRALVSAASEIAELDKHLWEVKRALAAALRDRYGVGKAEATGIAVCRTCGMSVRVKFNDAADDAVVVVADCSHIRIGASITAPVEGEVA